MIVSRFYIRIIFCRDLNLLDERIDKKCKSLESNVKKEEELHWHRIALLLDQNRVCCLFYA